MELQELYNMFLSNITDYTYIQMTDEELASELHDFYLKAKTKFKKSRKSLDYTDNGTTKEFNEATYEELLILSELMIVEYLRRQKLSTEVLKQSLSDKDFKIYSQANQLRELDLLYHRTRKEVNKLINEYTYDNLQSDWDDMK